MTSLSTIAVESSQCYQMVTSGPTQIAISGGWLQIKWSNRSVRKKARADKIESVSIGRSWFWDTLSIRLVDGEEYSVGGLTTGVAVRLRDALLADAERIKAEIAEARLRALTIGDELRRVEDEIAQIFSGDNYVRHSESLSLHGQLTTVMQKCTEFVREHLIPEALNAFQWLERFRTLEAFEKERDRVNKRFVSSAIAHVNSIAYKNFDHKLTNEQSIAIATDEDVTLVLAGAGTGKTSVILGKVAHLVENRGVSPKDILVLAFNSAAAQEIRDRLPQGLTGTHVQTFHAFGRRVIAEYSVAPDISKMAEDETLLTKAVNSWFSDLIGISSEAEKVTEFVAYNLAPSASPFDFDTAGEYYEFVRNWELRTLSGDLVKSLEEVEVANFLTLNGIEFRYEEPYPVSTADQRHRQYKPDFYLPDYDIYIEHFALDRNGQAPNGWSRYREGVDWKRRIHDRYRTTLIESYSWQSSEGILRDVLGDNLKSLGVEFRRVSITALLQRLAEWVVSWIARLLVRFLHHAKTNHISTDELRKRSNSGVRNVRQGSFLILFESIRDRYETALKNEGALDFHDLINRAAELIRDAKSTQSYRYVLVDEFQDIATGRMALLQSLNSPDTAYYLVGDDWQSINRFAGSDVSLMRNCDQYLGHTQTRELRQTFRYGGGILRPASEFVRKNPIQTQRTMNPAVNQVDDGISIIAMSDENKGVEFSLKDIEQRIGTDKQTVCSVLVLGRYGFNNPGLSPNWMRKGCLRVRYSTVHSAKGQEADYVIVLGLKSGRFGFPCKIEDDPLLRLVMPPISEGELPFAEERRLFYVAMTRARRGAYLVVNPDRPSEFVAELKSNHKFRQYGTIDDDLRPRCPNCRTGRLKESQSGQNLRCINHPSCDHIAPSCTSCSTGFTVTSSSGTSKCTNPECDKPSLACPECKIGALIKRNGRYGDFLGCTNYWSEPPCTFTRNLSPQASIVPG